MKQKRIRIHKRRWKDIENWRLDNLDLNVTDYLINNRDRCNAKIRIHPWSGISLTQSEIPQPRGKMKKMMLIGLLDIYEDWKQKLDQLGEPYFLKIWLFEPRFSQSQVVCAIGDSINFYKNTFFKPDIIKKINSDNYGQLKDRIEKFTWEYGLDEDHYDNTTIGNPNMYSSRQEYEEAEKWFERLLKNPHRLCKFKEPIGNTTESYSFKRGDVWIGGQK